MRKIKTFGLILTLISATAVGYGFSAVSDSFTSSEKDLEIHTYWAKGHGNNNKRETCKWEWNGACNPD